MSTRDKISLNEKKLFHNTRSQRCDVTQIVKMQQDINRIRQRSLLKQNYGFLTYLHITTKLFPDTTVAQLLAPNFLNVVSRFCRITNLCLQPAVVFQSLCCTRNRNIVIEQFWNLCLIQRAFILPVSLIQHFFS